MARKELSNEMPSEGVTAIFASHRIELRFTDEKAAWWRGVLERMVPCIKTFLEKSLGHSYLIVEDLTTILIETKVLINPSSLY